MSSWNRNVLLALVVFNLTFSGCDDEAEPGGSEQGVTPSGPTNQSSPTGTVGSGGSATNSRTDRSTPTSMTTSALHGHLLFQSPPDWMVPNDPTPVTIVLDLANSQQNVIRRRDLLDVSADGRELIYSEYDFGTNGDKLSLADRSGAVHTVIGPLSDGLRNVQFSPDGQHIAALVGYVTPGRLLMFTKTGANARWLLNFNISSFAFMPDGRILFVGEDNLCFLDPSTGAITGLGQFKGLDPRNLAPSPDGKHLALELGDHELLQNQVWVYDLLPTGGLGNGRQLTKQPGNSGTPAWSPDGTLIAFRNGLVYSSSPSAGSCPTVWVIDPNIPAPVVVGVDGAARPISRIDNEGTLRSPTCATSSVHWR